MGANRDSPYKGKSEGHACRARSEGRACHARGTGMDDPTSRRGRDKRVPPSCGPDKQVSPWGKPEVVQSVCPQKDS